MNLPCFYEFSTNFFSDKEGLQQQPQPVITSLQPVIITTSAVSNPRDDTQRFLESGGMLTLPTNNAAVVAEESTPDRAGNTDSGLFTSQY